MDLVDKMVPLMTHCLLLTLQQTRFRAYVISAVRRNSQRWYRNLRFSDSVSITVQPSVCCSRTLVLHQDRRRLIQHEWCTSSSDDPSNTEIRAFRKKAIVTNSIMSIFSVWLNGCCQVQEKQLYVTVAIYSRWDIELMTISLPTNMFDTFVNYIRYIRDVFPLKWLKLLVLTSGVVEG